MGYGKIVAGGPDGRYTIKMDYGQATKDAVLEALSPYLTEVNTKITETETKLEELREMAVSVQEQITAAIADMIEKQNNWPPGSPERTDDTLVKFLLQQRRALQLKIDPVEVQLAAHKFERARVAKLVAYWNELQLIEVRNAWCADLTEDREPGNFVATLDIPGDDSLIVIAPGCRTPTNADGQLVAREIISPAKAYFNAAISPGWAKFLPTYRWGTISSIDYEGGTADVRLGEARLTGQRLDVNQARALTGVPVEYMECNAEAFEVGDRVVIAFTGQDWAAPKLIGFLDNPKPCKPWPDVLLEYTPLATTEVTPAGGTADWADRVSDGICGPSLAVVTTGNVVSILSVATTFESIRFDSATWEEDGFELVIEQPTTYDWGNSDGLTALERPVPAQNPARGVYQTGGVVYERTAAWAPITYADYFNDPGADPPVICEVIDTRTANFWATFIPGDFLEDALNRTRVITALGDLPVPTTFAVKVRRGTITKTYEVKEVESVGSDGIPRTVRYSR